MTALARVSDERARVHVGQRKSLEQSSTMRERKCVCVCVGGGGWGEEGETSLRATSGDSKNGFNQVYVKYLGHSE